MHIIHVLTRLLRAGSEENTMATCQYQAQQGHRVTVIHGRDFDPYWYENPMPGVQMICASELVHPINVLQDIKAYSALRKLYQQLLPDVIHTHQSKAGVLGRISAGAVPNARIVHGVHILPFEGVSRLKRLFFIAIEKFCARKTDIFIGVSKAVCQAYVDAGIGTAENTFCVRSGMDLQRFQNPVVPEDWQEIIQLSPQEPRPYVVLMMAAFEPRKRHKAFLQALADSPDRDVKVLLAGQGPLEAEIRQLVCDLQLQQKVIFCGHRPDPERLLALSDALVLTSQREGLPRVVVQALAAGVPVIANHLPGLGEVVRHENNGLVFANNDIDALVKAMLHLPNEGEKLKRLRLGALNSDLSDWRLNTLGQNTTALYGRPILGPDKEAVFAS